MVDFKFLKNPISKKWVISAPRRAKRPDMAKGSEPACPFCPGREISNEETHRVPHGEGDKWKVRAIKNKYPFAPIHEVIINSPDHYTSYGNFTQEQTEDILKVYKHQYNEYSHAGQVYIFHNHGQRAGESLPHPHSQLAVIPEKVFLDVPRLEAAASDKADNFATDHFRLFCPESSQWPDEVWVAPKRTGRTFGEINGEELSDLATTLNKLIKIYDLRYNQEFPYNFYIYPGGDWYLRLIPRVKTLGGFEMGTNVFVNTQYAKESLKFIKDHFHDPDLEKIKTSTIDYHHTV